MTVLDACRIGLETLRDLFFPAHCSGCQCSISGDDLCPECRADLKPITQPRCPVCSRPFRGTLGSFVCTNCGDRDFHFDYAVACWESRGVMREMIHRLKYGRELTLAPVLGRLLSEGLADERIRERSFDGLVPVPLFATREREREFNQSEILARQLQKQCKVPIIKALRRIRSTTTQTHFDRRMRMQNLRDAFALRQNVRVQGLKLLLVDDVFTTGSTLDECARVLREGGAYSVCALTLARG